MAQAFITKNMETYRWPEISKRKSLKPTDKLAESLPEGDIWIVRKALGEAKEGEQEDDALKIAQAKVKEMYRKRILSTYQVDYCHGLLKGDEVPISAEDLEFQLIETCREYYKPRTQKIMPPLPTSRRLLGYIRPTNMYTPLTEYQAVYGYAGYKILEKNIEKMKEISKRTVC
ncbi:uncharacterized protein LOC108741931 [Agrilus planipennis]|uniref:Uncharacterized protein LOC108741931 n=1 Tax=Agrilus planipennis TaxID=224129 RepID=A0A1W4XJ66_AGRPL|nr:uncharacterized protein LOC108741931 [Agrilus planipennis]